MSAPPPAPWHSLPIEEALARLATDGRGLSSAEAARRLAAHGANKIPARPTAGLGAIFLRQFKSPLIYLLLAAGAVSLAVGETIDAGFIFVVLLVNAVVGAAQERGAEKGTSALESLIRLQATVKRDGAWTVVDGETVAPGDLARIESGEKTPADLRLLSARELRADESTLSGESTPVAKRAGVVAAAARWSSATICFSPDRRRAPGAAKESSSRSGAKPRSAPSSGGRARKSRRRRRSPRR